MDNSRWMTTKEAADYLRLKPETLRGMAVRGLVPAHTLPGTRTKRFHRDELDAALGLEPGAARSWGFADDLADEVAS